MAEIDASPDQRITSLARKDLRARGRRRHVGVSPDVDSKGAAYGACDIEDVSF